MSADVSGPDRACFECGAPATCAHHVIPRSRGGTKTVPLCGGCHGLAHGLSRETWSDHRALTIAGFAKRKAAGLHHGGSAPIGYQIDTDGRLTPSKCELEAIRVAAELRAAGLSLRKIGAALTERGLLPRGGGAWSAPAVGRLVAAR